MASTTIGGGVISIHAPRVGCDIDITFIVAMEKISIHAPRVGCDLRFLININLM